MKIINFAEQFVPLIESGRKTQTRRLIEPQPTRSLPHSQPMPAGDETWQMIHGLGWRWQYSKDASMFAADDGGNFERYLVEYSPYKIGEIFSVNGTDLHCIIEKIRVERVRDISQNDAIAEGSPKSHVSIDVVSREFGFKDFSRSWFGQKWESIYPGSWSRNEWVWVYEFKKV